MKGINGFQRSLATKASKSNSKVRNPLVVFDRDSKTIQRSRSASVDIQKSRKADFLRDEIANRTIERLAFITRSMDRVLDFGSHLGNFVKNLCTKSPVREQADDVEKETVKQLNKDKDTVSSKIKELVMLDSSKEILYRDASEPFNSAFEGKLVRQVADEEEFDNEYLKESNQYDAVISNLCLHWINDLPSILTNLNRILKPDGFFMGTIYGGDTLYELRTSLQLAEMERRGGLTPRISPMVHLNDIGSLMNRAGFSMLTIDPEEIVVGGFPDILTVCEELRAMGEQNAVISRSNYLPKDVLLAANEIYKSLHGEKGENGETTLPVTFSIMSMIGWKKSEAQPKPLERGTGELNLKDALKEKS